MRSVQVRSMLVVAGLLAAALAGCMVREDGEGDDDGDPAAQELLLTLVVVDPPEGMTGAVLNLTIDHVALFDEDDEAWVPLFTEAHEADILLDESVSDPAFLAAVPILSGTYARIELVATTARLITEEGSEDLDVPDRACYADVGFRATDGDVVTLEIYLSGSQSFEEIAQGWRFQPAAVGTISDADEGDAAFDEADCRSI